MVLEGRMLSNGKFATFDRPVMVCLRGARREFRA
jgi:hypothetical protein